MKEWVKRCEKIMVNNPTTPLDELLFCNAKVSFNVENFTIDTLKAEDIEITNYKPDSYIKMELLT
jgi:thymidylate synthase